MSLLCRIGLHKWRFVSAITLGGNLQKHQCARCGKRQAFIVEPFI